jgi:hypothetical protein
MKLGLIAVPVRPVSAEAFALYGDLLKRPASGTRQNFAAAVHNRRAEPAGPRRGLLYARQHLMRLAHRPRRIRAAGRVPRR